MGIQDLTITPLFFFILLFIAYLIGPVVTNSKTRPYYISALLVKFMAAIMLGIIYQYYYGGGDTFGYTTYGGDWIFKAFMDSPAKAFKLIFLADQYHFSDTFQYSQHIWYYGDLHSYFVVRVAGFFGLFTLSTYSSTALFFAAFSFSGSWALFTAIANLYSNQIKKCALAILFIPSVIFWGSGILKDTLTFGALCWLVWGLIHIVENGSKNPFKIGIVILAAFIIYSIKIYILMCFLSALFVWVYLKNINKIKNAAIRILIAPILLSSLLFVSYYSVESIGSTSSHYSLNNIAERAMVTAYDIRYGWGARGGENSGYTLGQLDGTWASMFRLAPAAINVSLFRPYLWEARNPFMLLSALESTLLLFLTLKAFFVNKSIGQTLKEPFLTFCLVFSIAFAFAVGVSTFNFGTLMRYKIPMLGFYLLAILINPKKIDKSIAKRAYFS
ncbi:MAG: hypothetical protein ABJF04_14515 [Reichenbachiella sp.]|uniref:hypothetical protein n=1 Tax=Reichenbachiella sp. TaxID=2184521 RepID=UPI003264D215